MLLGEQRWCGTLHHFARFGGAVGHADLELREFVFV